MVFQKGHIPYFKGTRGIKKPSAGSFKKGHIPWSKGKTGVYSKEALQKMSDARKGRIGWNKGKHISGMSGKQHSDETRRKMRIAAQDNPHMGNRGTTRHQRLVNQMARQLSKNGDKVEVEKPIRLGPRHWRIIDILVNDQVCFEIGNCKPNKIEELKQNGFKVVHLPYSILKRDMF